MKKILFLIFAAAFFTACETAPPQWWDPSGKYNTPASTQTAKPAATKKAAAVQTGTPIVEEEPVFEDNFAPILAPEVEVDELPLPSVLSE